jgi:hypothetical protein
MSNDELRAALYTATARRRVGLGRGLDSAIAGAEEESPPAHVQAFPAADLRLSISESDTGTTVSVSDGRGRSASVHGGWSGDGLRDAAIRAVAELVGVSVAAVTVTVATMGGATVMTVLLESDDGNHHAGAAVMDGTPAFAAVEAAVAALGTGAG